jgi:predicted dehydrogenase/8-oxo-dGTP pyrophosphatase MutT (NUDIX family)
MITAISSFSSVSPETLREPLWDRVTYCGVFIFNTEGKIICIRQKRGIDIPGGHTDPGESPLECLRRENLEEIWIPLDSVVLTEVREWTKEYKGVEKPLMAYFRADTIDDDSQIIELFNKRGEAHAHEASEVVFLTPEEFITEYASDRLWGSGQGFVENMRVALASSQNNQQSSISIGLVGLWDHQVRGHLVSINTDSRVRSILVFDPKWPQILQDVETKYWENYPGVIDKISDVKSDLDTILPDPSISAVFISSPDKFHASQTAESLKAGKHVFCEKPLINSSSEIDVLIKNIKLAQKRWLTLSSCHPRRFDRPFLWLKEYLNGVHDLWVIQEVKFNFDYPMPEEGKEWLHEWLLADHFNHEIDLVNFYLWFSHFTANRISDNQVQYEAMGMREDGIWFHFYWERRSPRWSGYNESITIVWQNGSIIVDTKTGEAILTNWQEHCVISTWLTTDYVGRFIGTNRNFIDAIMAGWRNYLTPTDLLMNNISWAYLTEDWKFDSRNHIGLLADIGVSE